MNNTFLFSLTFIFLACNPQSNRSTADQQSKTNVEKTTIEQEVNAICNCVKTGLTQKGEAYKTQMQKCANLTKKGKQKHNKEPNKNTFHTALKKCMHPLMPTINKEQKKETIKDKTEVASPK